MPFDVTSEQLIPTLLLNPDTRFATSFLDVKFRKYSVTGEALLDKSTGELFFRRKEDGKLVSFNQDYRDMFDQVWQLNVIKSVNPGFTYPSDTSTSLFLSTNYDIGCINDEKNVSINELNETSDGVFNIKNFAEADDTTGELEDIDSRKTLQFRISSDTKGFIAKVNTRATDKLAVEYLSKTYNNIFGGSVDSNDATLTAENEKFSDSSFEKNNAELTMTVRLSGTTEKSITHKAYVRLNESTFVDLTKPISQLLEDVSDEYVITVYIDAIDPYKVRRILDDVDALVRYYPSLQKDLRKVLYVDKDIMLEKMNIMHFVDSVDDILPLGNDIVISTFDIKTMKRLLGEINSVKFRPAIIVSATQPDPSEWAPGVLWAQRVTDIDMLDGSSYDAGSKIDPDWLASRVNFSATGYTKISTNPDSERDLLYTNPDGEEGSSNEE